MSILSASHFHNEEAAFERLEQIVWPNGPVCPKCGNYDGKRISRVTGATARVGLRRCLECKKQFTVKVGTVFASSHVPLHKWFQAAHLMASSKKGISAHQLHRTLQMTYKTAWFMAHRIREAMATGELNPFGSVDRAAGTARSMVVDDLKADTLAPIVRANIAREAVLMADEASYYTNVGREFADHEIVRHNAGEYGRGEFHTNTIEGYFSIFKRGMKGVYQHYAKKHLHRYLAEFDIRYNYRIALGVGDVERSNRALAGIVGKRLTYRDSQWARA